MSKVTRCEYYRFVPSVRVDGPNEDGIEILLRTVVGFRNGEAYCEAVFANDKRKRCREFDGWRKSSEVEYVGGYIRESK